MTHRRWLVLATACVLFGCGFALARPATNPNNQ